MSTELWLARIDRTLTEREQRDMMELLPLLRRERLQKLPREKHREVLCAYLLLRLALLEQYGWHDLPPIEAGQQGKPFFPKHPAVHFNLSHTAGAVAAAVSDTPVGIDIERIRPVGERFMERLAGVHSEEEFFQCWVRREARTKRTGSGIATMLRSETPLSRGEYYYEVKAFPGYVAGIATEQPFSQKAVHRLELDALL